MMGAIPIPENTIGRVGMVAALKRVGDSDIGKLVVLREPAGMVTSLVGSSKPVFAWLAQSLGEPVDCHGKQSRSIYVADRCLMPISEMSESDIEIISRSQAQADFDSALQEMKELIGRNDITPEELEHFVDKAGAQFFIERALEVVAVPVALREIGFYPSPESEDSLVWTGIHEGMELHFLAGEKWIANWVIVGTGNSKRQAVWDERTLPSQAPRGKIVSTVLSIWRTAFGKSVTPDCLKLGDAFERHQSEMSSLNLGLPNLWAAPQVFRAILKWLRPQCGFASPDGLVTLSYTDGLLRFDVEGSAFGCPAGGHWVDDCKVRLADLVDLFDSVNRSRSIRLERAADHILVNGLAIEIH
jgi:hypothetical protein